MRYQQPIYNQTGRFVRNRDHLNVNTSSDLYAFTNPIMEVSGATKIIDSYITCSFSGVPYSDIVTGITVSCSGTTAFTYTPIYWYNNIDDSGEEVSSALFHTDNSITGTPTENQYLNSLNSSLNLLGYEFTNTGSTYTIKKPFGSSDLLFTVCAEPSIDGLSGCTSFTATSSCDTTCNGNFEVLTSASTGVYIVEDEEGDITMEFTITGETESMDEINYFFYEIYKYNHDSKAFELPSVYTSDNVPYSAFSATSFTELIPVEDLNIDGDYLIKGYFNFGVPTGILKCLGETVDTSDDKSGQEYNLYNSAYDYYFVVVKVADEPVLQNGQDSVRQLGALVAQSVLIKEEGETMFTPPINYEGRLLVYLNGLLLALNLDYTLSNGLLTLKEGSKVNDVLTYVYVANSDTDGPVVDNIIVDEPITSGATDMQGSNLVYYNTTEGKYEIYTQATPINGNDIVVTLNGVTLANNIDYYQSITNPNRIILEGELMVGDIINIVYNAFPQYVNEVFTSLPTIYWGIPAPPLANGIFTLELASDSDFTTIVNSVQVNYIAEQSSYAAQIGLTGSLGDTYYYRVKNEKNYVSLSGDIIQTVAYSDTVPIIISSNDLNSY